MLQITAHLMPRRPVLDVMKPFTAVVMLRHCQWCDFMHVIKLLDDSVGMKYGRKNAYNIGHQVYGRKSRFTAVGYRRSNSYNIDDRWSRATFSMPHGALHRVTLFDRTTCPSRRARAALISPTTRVFGLHRPVQKLINSYPTLTLPT